MHPGNTAVQKMPDPIDVGCGGQVHFLADRKVTIAVTIAWAGASLVDDFSTMMEVTSHRVTA
jgi:hypothetical protein